MWAANINLGLQKSMTPDSSLSRLNDHSDGNCNDVSKEADNQVTFDIRKGVRFFIAK